MTNQLSGDSRQVGIVEPSGNPGEFERYNMYKMTKKKVSDIMTKKTRSAKCHTKRRFVNHTLHLITTYVRTMLKTGYL